MINLEHRIVKSGFEGDYKCLLCGKVAKNIDTFLITVAGGPPTRQRFDELISLAIGEHCLPYEQPPAEIKVVCKCCKQDLFIDALKIESMKDGKWPGDVVRYNAECRRCGHENEVLFPVMGKGR